MIAGETITFGKSLFLEQLKTGNQWCGARATVGTGGCCCRITPGARNPHTTRRELSIPGTLRDSRFSSRCKKIPGLRRDPTTTAARSSARTALPLCRGRTPLISVLRFDRMVTPIGASKFCHSSSGKRRSLLHSRKADADVIAGALKR